MRASDRYGPSLALLTDLYQLTMAQGYWKTGMADHHACFHLFFRTAPFGGAYALAAGLADALDYVEKLRFDDGDLGYLATLRGSDGGALFDPAFLDQLRELRLEVDIDAVPEGTVMFPGEPMLRVTGPILHCQLLETPLLTLVNFPSLIATKAARVCEAAQRRPVIEFGLRRAQSPDGGLVAARAAYIGGCDSTSNVLAGRMFGIPVKGTHAHSWVMAFGGDRPAFEAWARAMPNNCLFLVDTFDSIEGVKTAVQVAAELREQGHEMIGIRLDSGDLAELSVESRRILDESGFPYAAVLASGDLDEDVIGDLEARGATIQLFGVGTRLTTGHPDASLDGIYKLAAIKPPGAEWEPRIKVSDSPAKTTVPGVLGVRRFIRGGELLADVVHDLGTPLGTEVTSVELATGDRRRIGTDADHVDLLVPVVRGGKPVYDPPPLVESRDRARRQIESLPAAVRRIDEPERYFVGLEHSLFTRRERMVREHRRHTG